MSDSKFGIWSPAESPIAVEYSLVVIEEIRHEVAEGFQRLSRGGIEVGGVLYGVRDGRAVRVMAMRPIACEHARGPGFALSDRDRVALNEQLTRDSEDPRLEGLISVGWFLSHTRSEIALSEADLEIFSIFFPAPWQIVMIVRPGRGGSMRAGFFVREPDGTVKSEHSYLEFNFPDRLAGVFDRPPDRPRPERGESRRVPGYFRAEATAPAALPVPSFGQPPQPEAGAPQFPDEATRKSRWMWLTLWAVLVLAAAGGAAYYWMPWPLHWPQTARESLSLAVAEHEGQLAIQWNPAAKAVRTAARGSLEIIDGADTRTIALQPVELAAGRSTYVRKSGDVQVRMTLEDSDGGRTEEASRFLGRPPAAVVGKQDLLDLQKQRDDLQSEVSQLRRQNEEQATRIQTLDRTLRILQTRLGITDQGKQ